MDWSIQSTREMNCVQANQVPVENVLAFGMPEPGDSRKSSPFSHLFVLLHKAGLVERDFMGFCFGLTILEQPPMSLTCLIPGRDRSVVFRDAPPVIDLSIFLDDFLGISAPSS